MMDIPGVSFSGAWKNRIKSTYDNEPANIMGIEDLIQAKKTSNRDQDRLDLRNLELKRESKP